MEYPFKLRGTVRAICTARSFLNSNPDESVAITTEFDEENPNTLFGIFQTNNPEAARQLWNEVDRTQGLTLGTHILGLPEQVGTTS